MNVDDGRIMRSWRSCLFLYIIEHVPVLNIADTLLAGL